MSLAQDLIRCVVAGIDRLMRKRLDIWEFSDDPDCILRVGLVRSHWQIRLNDGTVIEPGEVIGMIHAWNERVPGLPPGGADLAWARELYRRLTRSLQLLAQAAQEDPRLMAVRGFGGQAALEFSPGILRLLQRLGIETYALPARSLRQRLEARVNLVWTWLMRRAFNPPSTEGRGPKVLRRRFYWLDRNTLLARYGSAGGHGGPDPEPPGGIRVRSDFNGKGAGDE